MPYCCYLRSRPSAIEMEEHEWVKSFMPDIPVTPLPVVDSAIEPNDISLNHTGPKKRCNITLKYQTDLNMSNYKMNQNQLVILLFFVYFQPQEKRQQCLV
jgi:hypothetical protein